MAALFGHGNPLATQVGQLIERGTDGSQPSENWGMYMEVCDLINERDEGPKDAIKAFRKRLNQNMGKNNTAVMYTLTCLETCVKNCGRRFHIQVANKDFLNDMVKVIGPKYEPPPVVQEKVLSLIQTWADAFRGTPDLKDVEKVYQDLKSKGIEFPMTDLDHLAPIHTPARTGAGTDPDPPVIARTRGSTTNRSAHTQGTVLPPQAVAPPQPMVPASTGAVVPTQEMLAKLKSELDVVQGNVRVMSEMLTELTPSDVDSSDLELLQELNRTNRQMQSRIVELLEGVPNEEVMNELLRVNDDLNNVFLRYERFERYRTGQTGQGTQEPTPEPAPTESLAPPSYNDSVQTTNPKVADLIDLGGEESTNVTNQMAQMNVSGQTQSPGLATTQNPQSDDFDMFAQSRKSFDQNRDNLRSGGGYVNESDRYNETLGQAVNMKSQPDTAKSNEDEILQLQDKETDYDEMERWLETQEPVTALKTAWKSELSYKNRIKDKETQSQVQNLTVSYKIERQRRPICPQSQHKQAHNPTDDSYRKRKKTTHCLPYNTLLCYLLLLPLHNIPCLPWTQKSHSPIMHQSGSQQITRLILCHLPWFSRRNKA